MWQGHMFCESAKTGNDKSARRMESAHRTRLAEGLVGIREKKTVPTLEHFLQNRIEPKTIEVIPTNQVEANSRKRARSYKWLRSGLRPLLKHSIARMKLDGITSEIVSEYVTQREVDGVEIGTINRELRVLRRVLRLAVEWKVVEHIQGVQMVGEEPRRERIVGDDEFTQYLRCSPPLLADVAQVLNETGLRPDECHRLDWDDIVFANRGQGKLSVRFGKTKAARRTLPMTPRVRALLEARWDTAGNPATGSIWPAPTKTGHIDHSSLKKQHRNALKLSGVRPFLLYSLRHTFATRIAPHVDAWTLCKIMGWSSLAVAMNYIHPSEERVLSAFSSVTRYNSGYSAAQRKLTSDENRLEVTAMIEG